MQIQAIYKDGKFIPLAPVHIKESNEPITLEIVRPKISKIGSSTDLALQLAKILGPASKKRSAPDKQQDRDVFMSAVEGK